MIQGRQGLVAFEPIILRGADSVAVAVRVAQYMESFDADAVFIDGSGGYGAGVIDHLRRLNLHPMEVQFGGEPMDPRFANKRAEMWVAIRDWLRDGGALPNMNEYRIDLTGTRYDYANARGRLQLEPKERLLSRGLPSPDVGDALALTFAAPVAPRDRLDNPFFGIDLAQSVTKTRHEYDPLERP